MSHCPVNIERICMWNGFSFSVKRVLSLEEVFELIDYVMDVCSNDDGEIRREVVSFAFMCGVVSFFACVELPDDIEERYKVMYATDLYETVVSNVSKKQVDSIREIIMSYTGVECKV